MIAAATDALMGLITLLILVCAFAMFSTSLALIAALWGCEKGLELYDRWKARHDRR